MSTNVRTCPCRPKNIFDSYALVPTGVAAGPRRMASAGSSVCPPDIATSFSLAGASAIPVARTFAHRRRYRRFLSSRTARARSGLRARDVPQASCANCLAQASFSALSRASMIAFSRSLDHASCHWSKSPPVSMNSPSIFCLSSWERHAPLPPAWFVSDSAIAHCGPPCAHEC